MHGAGTNPDITTSRDYPVVLDISRLVSRVGRGSLTGVDRVELAYLNWCLEGQDSQLFCLARISGGLVLLDRSGALEFRAKLNGDKPWGPRDIRARLSLRAFKDRGAAESDLRRLAVARSRRKSLPNIPLTHGVYLNVGHSNLTESTLSGVRAKGLRVAVLIHDMIPLDWPQFQREGTVKTFESKMRVAAKYGDMIIANSNDTQRRVRHYFDRWGSEVQSVVSHLGVDEFDAKPRDIGVIRPYFTAIGTIEPRKNHALLLDVWEKMEEELSEDELPELHIVGQRGWNNDAVFKRLDGLKDKSWLHEHHSMGDADLKRLLSGSHGLLFPSFAEGFGLPSIEAAQLGVPVICGDLAIHEEVLGDYPVYADLQDIYLWKKIILEQAEQRQKDLIHANLAKKPRIPTWSEHFRSVNAAVRKLF